MSKMVSARVPDAVYESACSALRDIGSSPSELVNAAFEFVLKNKALPLQEREAQAPRRLSKDQRAKLARVFADCTLGISPVDDVAQDKRIVREARVTKHEALA